MFSFSKRDFVHIFHRFMTWLFNAYSSSSSLTDYDGIMLMRRGKSELQTLSFAVRD
jgi:hypothetical protein